MSTDIYVIIEHTRGQISDISYTMLAAGRQLANGTGGKVVAVLLGHNAQGLSVGLAADQVLYIDHPALADFNPSAYLNVLGDLIPKYPMRAVFFGDTTIGGDLGARLASRLSIPLISHCLKVRAEGSELYFVSQICGGKIQAEGILPTPTAMVMFVPGGYKSEQGQSDQTVPVVNLQAPSLADLPVTFTGYIEPESADIDISRESILVSIGRGIQNEGNIELAEELAKALGGVLCASRPVVDQGWLPTTRLVGKSGKKVKPKLYLTLGISGSPEHAEAITDSDMIVAINIDPKAPIFDLATYGVTLSLFDVIEVLTEKINQAKA
jgi:electron transfer flavoprotein alpha subunit